MKDLEPPAEDPDIVQVVLQRVLASGFSPALAAQIDQDVRVRYGGLRVRIPKRAKYLTVEQREKVFQDGLTGMSTGDITAKHKISRATLYREMKRGGRFGGSG